MASPKMRSILRARPVLLRTNPVKHTATRGRDGAAAVPVGIYAMRASGAGRSGRGAAGDVKHGPKIGWLECGCSIINSVLESVHYEYQK